MSISRSNMQDNIVQDKVGVTTGMKVRDDQNLKNLEKIQEVKNFTDEPTVSDDLDASTTIVEQRTPIYKKYMHKSIAKQNDDKVINLNNPNWTNPHSKKDNGTGDETVLW